MTIDRSRFSFKKRLNYAVQGIALFLFFGLFRILPLSWASGFGAWITRFIGPKLAINDRRVRVNLNIAFPDQGRHWQDNIIRQMWDHLGRTMAEAAHLKKIVRNSNRITVTGEEYLSEIKQSKNGCIVISAHIGNWEIAPFPFKQAGIKTGVVYRPPNNKWADILVKYIRRHTADDLIAKGPKGARAAMRLIRNGGAFGALVDQKMNDGVEADFFNQPAMTPDAPAVLHARLKIPIYSVRAVRKPGSQFDVIIDKIADADDRDKGNIKAITQRINDHIESWVNEHPEQYLWLHRRWDKSLYG